jgi:Domain of unknown function (DUF4352)
MAESTPHWAPIVVLLFLGALFVTGISIVVLLYGAARRSKLYARMGGGAALVIVTCYVLLLSGVSLASSEKVLPVGAWKYFCEIDCHIGYSVSSVRTAASLGPELLPARAHGRFVVVHLKVWFDERTISSNRGDGPLMPNARRVVVVDSRGRAYQPSPQGENILARASGEQTSLRQALRPGQSFTKDLVFDVPPDAGGLRLLITEDDPETHLIIGHENSLLHKKIYLSLDTRENIAMAIKPLGFNN